MALTLGTPSIKVPGAEYVSIVDITFDSSYPANGEAVTPATFGLRQISTILPALARDPDTADLAVLLVFDSAASKLVAFWVGSVDGPLEEVPNTTDLSAYTASVVAYGV